jgi:3'-5' exoribonuclease
MKQQFINAIKAGDAVADVFVLQEKTLGRKKDGNAFLNVTLADRTGRLRGVMWDNADEVALSVAAAEFVRIRGNASEYQGRPQVVIRSMEMFPAADVSAADFIPSTSRNTDAMFDRLVRIADGIRNPHLRQLLSAFWEDPDLVNGLKTAPAAKKMHHAYLGGLLEHTLSMTILVDRLAGHYSGLDMDLLLTGAVLHDIGKIREYEYRYKIDYSDEGRLLTHILIGCQMLDEKIRTLEGFPPDLAVMLKHLIVSHHGSREFGSPEPPKTIEAVLLNHIDDMDAKVNGIREYMAAQDPTEAWTPYHHLLGRQFYRGKNGEKQEEQES